MHQTRQEISKKLSIPRKGTKYVARAKINPNNAVPVVLAVRDLLHLAKTSREVKEMIKSKKIKINDRLVYDFNDSIQLLQILEVGKHYQLSLTETGKYILNPIAPKTLRVCKVIGRTLISGNKIQINLHDGSNIISNDKIKVGDSLHLDSSGKMHKHIPLEKGAEILVIAGKYLGKKGKVKAVDLSILSVSLSNGVETNLNKNGVMAL
jgi:small subunit ribosomal protein S4e